MALAPIWKVKRELRRVAHQFEKHYRLTYAKTLIYEGLRIEKRRSGMIDEIIQQLFHNSYEQAEIAGIRRVIRPGDRVLELGAGLGIITALAARAAGPAGRVRAYEANPALVADTRTFLAANRIHTVDVVNAVLAPESGPSPRLLHLARSFAESSLLGVDGRNPVGTVEVRAESLADVLAGFRPDVLICDIEGAEAELLPGLPPSSLRAAVVELHPDRLDPFQIAAIHAGLSAQGLERQTPSPGGTVEVYLRPASGT